MWRVAKILVGERSGASPLRRRGVGWGRLSCCRNPMRRAMRVRPCPNNGEAWGGDYCLVAGILCDGQWGAFLGSVPMRWVIGVRSRPDDGEAWGGDFCLVAGIPCDEQWGAFLGSVPMRCAMGVRPCPNNGEAWGGDFCLVAGIPCDEQWGAFLGSVPACARHGRDRPCPGDTGGVG